MDCIEDALLHLLPRPHRVGHALLDPLDDALGLGAVKLHARVVDPSPYLPEPPSQRVDVGIESFLILRIAGRHEGAVVDGHVEEDDAGAKLHEISLSGDGEILTVETVDDAADGDDCVWVVTAEEGVVEEEDDCESPSQVVCPSAADG